MMRRRAHRLSGLFLPRRPMDARVERGIIRGCGAREKPDLNVKQPCGIGRGLWGAAGPFASSFPRQSEGAERQEALPSFVTPCGVASPAGDARLPALRSGDFAPRDRSFRGRTGGVTPALIRGGFRLPSSGPRPAHRRAVPRSRDGRLPGASRDCACEAQPRAPHPAPPTERLRKAPSIEQGGYRNTFWPGVKEYFPHSDRPEPSPAWSEKRNAGTTPRHGSIPTAADTRPIAVILRWPRSGPRRMNGPELAARSRPSPFEGRFAAASG